MRSPVCAGCFIRSLPYYIGRGTTASGRIGKESSFPMSNPTVKKGFGFFATLCAAVLSIAAAGYFVSIHGTFGLDSTHNGVCYDPAILFLLFGGAAVAVVLALLNRCGLAAAITAAASGAAICVFVHKCYWYVVDVFVGIDEKHGFDPRFITFVALIAAAFLVGEIAIYTRKTKTAA